VTPYWHVQDRTGVELRSFIARRIVPGWGIQVAVPVRTVRDHIRFEDLDRQPFVPPNPDTHHRNETLTHIADAQVATQVARPSGSWMMGLSAGVSVPIGRTEPNPFELGHLGLPHQHIQFGTGTWDPIASVSASRPLAGLAVGVTGAARFTLYENSYGYRAGNMYAATVNASPNWRGAWGLEGDVTLSHENAERWDGHVEEEGNLGRTDLFLGVGVRRRMPPVGAVSLHAQFPVATRTVGDQVHYPAIVSLSWMR
jgi:hypothetical protein